MSVLEAIQEYEKRLAACGIDSPRLQVELMLAYILNIPRFHLYLEPQQILTESEQRQLHELLERRHHREPLQYLLGSTSFCGLDILVTPQVLIPRPETEILAEQAWQLLETPPANWHQPPTVLDFGTGSGCLAIALANHCPDAQIHAVDISAEALKVAESNAARHGLEQRIQFHQRDGFQGLASDLQFELIVANPPYIASNDLLHLQPEVRDYEPHKALDGGPDGLDFYRRLARESLPWLRSNAWLMAEFGDGQGGQIVEIFQALGWEMVRIEKDLNQRPRVLVVRR